MPTSEHFSESELACHHCGEGVDQISPRLLELLEQLRANVGGPLSLSCAYRCPYWNEQVGGVQNSQHTQGNAADILCPDYLTIGQLKWYCEQLPFDGIGYYPPDGGDEDSVGGFIHVDTRDGGVDGGYRWEG